ncbi:(2Fe-2S)-binding protein [Maledivibacter halophilus]|uniref:Carbon-monoxide dehydrogenase small subunit n=1 Tax=Maledivibacter halophilus TaxID=36842 RepID=A0A1T5L1N9_9FIRM|nr:2Fe-2S iron-sulfur cluster-binding protein [Maledivibacter halophilus]SKC69871.1 carbon-monoxide dehydrogenase small subunit [Maledivibacter halophilus]
MNVVLIINNKKRKVDVKPDEFLLDTLRKIGYTSVRRGCDTSSCGLCTIWVDGKAVLSCTYLTVRAVGKSITTLEGVREEAKEFTGFLADEGADQCGYCAPGFIMTVLAMEKELDNPGDEEIYHYLNGNLCRCTGYKGQIRAIRKYLESKAQRGEKR